MRKDPKLKNDAFVKENICKEVFEVKNRSTSFELITTFKLANAHTGSFDIGGIRHILDNNGVVKNYPRLHSKIYLFDDAQAIVTSGNLTNGGLLTNFEYGILIDDVPLVKLIKIDFELLVKETIRIGHEL